MKQSILNVIGNKLSGTHRKHDVKDIDDKKKAIRYKKTKNIGNKKSRVPLKNIQWDENSADEYYDD